MVLSVYNRGNLKAVKRGAVLLRTQLDLVLVSIDSCSEIRTCSKRLASGDKIFRFNFFNQPLQASIYISVSIMYR